jgi:hypothetical protein
LNEKSKTKPTKKYWNLKRNEKMLTKKMNSLNMMRILANKKSLLGSNKLERNWNHFYKNLEIVEKSFGGKIEGCGKKSMSFYYLFSQSARNENYRKTVAEPTIAEIFGINKLDQEINTTITGSGPGVPGLSGGNFSSNQYQINYSWIDGPQGGHFCRI